MSYIVLARRFRPQRFDELLGQEGVTRTLRNAIDSGRIAHAYLFCGPRGTGKTSAARILAKSLNCVEGPTAEPCNVCDICQRISVGDDLDVVEMDAASNTGVDYIRELRENAQYSTGRARFKIYIIDEVHMLSTQAFNALLKTLEEPPPHVKFIFATTEPQKLPETVRSRCQRFDFRQLSTAEIAQALQAICEREDVKTEDGALIAVARHARGGMRDALSLLDQAISYAGGRGSSLTAELVRELTGAVDEQTLLDLLAQIAAGDAPDAVRRLSALIDTGLDPAELADALIERYRELMLLESCGKEADVAAFAGPLRADAEELAGRYGLDKLLYALRLLHDARRDCRAATHPRIPLEMAVLRLARTGDLADLGTLAGQVSALLGSKLPEAPPQTAQTRSRASTQSRRAGNAAPSAPVQDSWETATAEPPQPGAPKAPPASDKASSAGTSAVGDSVAEVQERWDDVRERLRKPHPRVYHRLEQADVTNWDGRTVTVALPAARAMLLHKLDQPAERQVIVDAFSAELGRDVDLRFETRMDAPSSAPQPSAAAQPKPVERPRPEPRKRAPAALGTDPEENPVVQEVRRRLKGKIVAKDRGAPGFDPDNLRELAPPQADDGDDDDGVGEEA